MSRNGKISEKSKEQMSLKPAEQLTLFQGDFHAQISLSPVAKSGLKEKEVVYGLKCLGSFAKFDPSSSSWKTYQRSLLNEGDLESFCETYTRLGLMQNGLLFEIGRAHV